MTSETQQRQLTVSRLRKAAQGFKHYCEDEFQRRTDSGELFDEPAYREAMEMVVSKLISLEDTGA